MGNTVRSTTSGSCKGSAAVGARATGSSGVAPVGGVGGLDATASCTGTLVSATDVCGRGARAVAASCLARVSIDTVSYAIDVYIGVRVEAGLRVVGGRISAAPQVASVRGCSAALCAVTARDDEASGVAGVRDVDASGIAGTSAADTPRIMADFVDAPGVAAASVVDISRISAACTVDACPENGSGAAKACIVGFDGRVVAAAVALLDASVEPG